MPEQLQWTKDEARVVLQAIKNVGTAGGVLELQPIVLEMMEAIQAHVLHSSIVLHDLEIIPPTTYPDLISSETKRNQLIQILVKWSHNSASGQTHEMR